MTAVTSAALTVTKRAFGAEMPSAAEQAAVQGLDAKALEPLAAAVLPAELGSGRIQAEALAFSRWIAGYRAGEETLHPYGSERLGVTGPSPAAKWASQLTALDSAARAAHGKSFADVTAAQRSALVRQALSAVQLNARVPSPIAAPHVAIAMLSHFLETPAATNLAYDRVIDPQQCRPLASSPLEPVALRRGGRA
mgnify:CR=1 FL=1